MMDETIQIQVRFTLTDPDSGVSFTDALYYPLSHWPVPPDQIEADKQKRFSEWMEALNAPTPAVDTPQETPADDVTT
jgi:hypothetical protein